MNRLTKPILFENVHDWKIINCTAAGGLFKEAVNHNFK